MKWKVWIGYYVGRWMILVWKGKRVKVGFGGVDAGRVTSWGV